MSHYGDFLMKRFVIPYLKKGSWEVHLLFDDPGRLLDIPKQYEQSRRDQISASSDHVCHVFFNDAEVPAKWKEILKCRACKRSLTVYLSDFFTENIRPFLGESQKYVTSGAAITSSAVMVTKGGGVCTCDIESSIDESDTRVWLHSTHSAGTKKFILSPDTDIFHIGLPARRNHADLAQ